MEERIVTLRAKVVGQQENALIVRLEDGFGHAQVVVHEAHAQPA